MHRTIVQNKIIVLFVLAVFFCPANIYRPSLGKVGYVGLIQNRFSGSIFISEENEKTPIYSELYALQRAEDGFSISIFIYFLKNILKMYQKTCKIF